MDVITLCGFLHQLDQGVWVFASSSRVLNFGDVSVKFSTSFDATDLLIVAVHVLNNTDMTSMKSFGACCKVCRFISCCMMF